MRMAKPRSTPKVRREAWCAAPEFIDMSANARYRKIGFAQSVPPGRTTK